LKWNIATSQWIPAAVLGTNSVTSEKVKIETCSWTCSKNGILAPLICNLTANSSSLCDWIMSSTYSNSLRLTCGGSGDVAISAGAVCNGNMTVNIPDDADPTSWYLNCSTIVTRATLKCLRYN